MHSQPSDHQGDTPYPLRYLFMTRILPLLAVAVVAIVVATGWLAGSVAERVYLQLAQRRAENIGQALQRDTPELWQNVLQGKIQSPRQRHDLTRAIAREAKEFGVLRLKVYGRDGVTLYSHDPNEIGSIEVTAALKRVIDEGEASAVAHTEADGSRVYELYVPFRANGKTFAVFELYEPINRLRPLLWSSAAMVAAAPLAALAGVLAGLVWLVTGAQRSIDRRTREIVDLKNRIGQLVSRTAVDAVSAPAPPSNAGVRKRVSVLYSDVRGFTRFCESHDASEVIARLNQLMATQTDLIERHGGDVDKFVGDAIMARFEGENANGDAVRCGQEILRACRSDGELQVGIGIASGDVIAGFIGAPGRHDYTIIGDVVNVAARLSAVASGGELIASDEAVADSGDDGFSCPQVITVKGRRQGVSMRRWRATAQ